MSKIKIFGLGGLNENGKDMYVIDVDNDIFVFVYCHNIAQKRYFLNINPIVSLFENYNEDK